MAYEHMQHIVDKMAEQEMSFPEDRIAELEAELAEARNISQDAPEGWKYFSVLVPVRHMNGETYLDGQALAIIDTVKVKGYVEENKRLREFIQEVARCGTAEVSEYIINKAKQALERSEESHVPIVEGGSK